MTSHLIRCVKPRIYDVIFINANTVIHDTPRQIKETEGHGPSEGEHGGAHGEAGEGAGGGSDVHVAVLVRGELSRPCWEGGGVC